ncbi:MAG: hypothetical protein VB858_21400 [Planctomycetaceae bacterium]
MIRPRILIVMAVCLCGCAAEPCRYSTSDPGMDTEVPQGAVPNDNDALLFTPGDGKPDAQVQIEEIQSELERARIIIQNATADQHRLRTDHQTLLGERIELDRQAKEQTEQLTQLQKTLSEKDMLNKTLIAQRDQLILRRDQLISQRDAMAIQLDQGLSQMELLKTQVTDIEKTHDVELSQMLKVLDDLLIQHGDGTVSTPGNAL